MADYNMSHTGAQLDDMIENGIKKNADATMSGSFESTVSVKAPILIGDTIKSADGLNMVDVTTIAETNIYNIATNNIPTSDPGISGRIWNDGGILKVSP